MAQPPDERAALDRDDDEEDLDRAYRRQVAQNLQSLAAWLDDWDTQPTGALDDALDADAEMLPDDQRDLIEEARTIRDGAVAQVRALVTTLRASMNEQEGSA
jgi:hypothetical protein